MEAHIANYSDEWRAVLEDPVKLARFTSFVNAPGVPDPSIEFVQERGQPTPAQRRPGQPVVIAGPKLAVVR